MSVASADALRVAWLLGNRQGFVALSLRDRKANSQTASIAIRLYCRGSTGLLWVKQSRRSTYL